jgi:PTH1 family peptidyl-tRNA hydrolase
MKLIFAQGNPDNQYDRTRHNIGFAVVDAVAESLNLKWTEKKKFHSLIAETTLDGEKVLFVKPVTFYNETGIAARKLVDFYDLDTVHDLLVIHDDLALPFGTIRSREKGSDAGNNGIKSLNSHIGPEYHRIRIGIWNELRDRMEDADFVLSKFNKEESIKLTSDIIPHVTDLTKEFIHNTLNSTSHHL